MSDFIINPFVFQTGGGGGAAAGFANTTAVSDVGRATYTTSYYNGGAADEATVTITLPFSVTYFGTSYSQIRVNSNSYFGFGTTTPATFPYYSWSPTANGPSIGILAHPGSSTDANYRFVGSITSGSTFTLRWEGGYPYYNSTVNRIWEVVFTSGSNEFKINLIDTSARDSSGQGQNLVASDGSTARYTVLNPASNSSYILGAF